MSGNLTSLRLACDGCGHLSQLTASDLDGTTPVDCPGCGRPLGTWGDLAAASRAESGPDERRARQ